MSKTSKIIFITILIFIAVYVAALSIAIFSINMANYSYNYAYVVKYSNQDESKLNDKQRKIVEYANSRAKDVEDTFSKNLQEENTGDFHKTGLEILMGFTGLPNIGRDLLLVICLGAVVGGLINMIFIANFHGKKLFEKFIGLYVILYISTTLLLIMDLTIKNQSIGNPTFQNIENAFAPDFFYNSFMAYTIWFLVLWIVHRIYRKSSANVVTKKSTGVKNVKKAKEKKKAEAETEQRAAELKQKLEENPNFVEKRTRDRKINSEARTEIEIEKRKTNQAKAELEGDEDK